MSKWTKKRKRVKKQMSEQTEAAAEPVKEKIDKVNDIKVSITRAAGGSALDIYIRAPEVAKVIRKMADSNYEAAKYADIYKPILKLHPQAKERAITKKAVTVATKKFGGGTDFSFTEPPRAILLANADALEEGYTLTYTLDAPVPMDQLKKWGKDFADGCKEIIASARPFKMTWVVDKDAK